MRIRPLVLAAATALGEIEMLVMLR